MEARRTGAPGKWECQLGNMTMTSVVEVEGMTGFLFTVGLFFAGFKKGFFLKSSKTASSVPSCAT